MKKITQKQNVIDTLKMLDRPATLSELYQRVDVKNWGTKTPFASIRRILQTNAEFIKIQPGLWSLKSSKNNQAVNNESFSHAYFQGIIAQLGKMNGYETFIPAQDKNKTFLSQKLKDLASLEKIYSFTYENLVQKASHIDVVWFNTRKLPHSFFEVEHSTNFKNSLNKFYELQDFRAQFLIVASKNRKLEFESAIENTIYADIQKLVKFLDYENLVLLFERASEIAAIKTRLPGIKI